MECLICKKRMKKERLCLCCKCSQKLKENDMTYWGTPDVDLKDREKFKEIFKKELKNKKLKEMK